MKPENFFAGFYEWDNLKLIFLIQHVLLTAIAPVLFCSIFEYDYSQNQRLLSNQLLNHLCKINLVNFASARILNVAYIYFGPFPDWYCQVVVHGTRFFFLLFISEIFLWQTIKHLQRFKPRYILVINDDFFASFLTLLTVFFNSLHVVVAHMTGMLTGETDYHICTGRSPQENTRIIFQYFIKIGKNERDFLEPTGAENGLGNFIIGLGLAVLISATVIWLSGLKGQNSSQPLEVDPNNGSMLSAGGSFLLTLLLIALVTPSFVASSYAKSDPNSLNSGPGKTWMYLSRMAVSASSFFVFPSVILIGNANLRSYTVREARQFLQTNNFIA